MAALATIRTWAPEVLRGKRMYSDEKFVASIRSQFETDVSAPITERQLEALLIVASQNKLLIISGNGEVIEPDDDIAAIGSGGNYALAAARALISAGVDLNAAEIAEKSLHIAADICVFTNHNVNVMEL